MVNTLPYLSFIPAHVMMSFAIIFFFLAKAVPFLKRLPASIVFFLVLIACFWLESLGSGSEAVFFEMIQVDSYSRLYNQILFIAIAVTILMMANSDELNKDNNWEIFGLLATVCLGMMLMTSATNLLMTVVAIELVSIPSYVLVALNRKLPASKEASLKYVLFGSFAAGIMVYGMSLIFGLTGTLKFSGIWKGLAEYSAAGNAIYFLAVLMTLSGMVFKIAAVPFHFWCPDAYQAAPTPITAFLSTAPKVAGLALLMRFFSYHVSLQTANLTLILSIIAMATMTLGNLAALKQTDIKRLLAYSSISHAGFLLMGIAVLNSAGRQAVFFYIPIYLLMNLGAFMAVIYLSRGDRFDITSYAGMIKKKPLVVIGLTVCLFSLAGLPPFAGFVGKFYLFKVVIEEGLILLAVVAAINSVISLFYYVGVIKVMVIDSEDRPSKDIQTGGFPVVFVTACIVPIVFLGVYWVPLLNWAEKAKLLF
ncbi:MAG: NADH-quinone oxidoreductase subunit N [Deltaproteobacteria bacterium]|jgi:NADH-quinone oxidoreductase subunit N|nr:NADH-quinone oxidoreductase subunit N [Deltaproteobacteria bacterium]MBT4090542.1 NADH-quinone oxidoreductase subunit N [Deltaproteobacteria bacterium]MBT4268173.1 NADH-quinone oxidoreductase subunit N [Deltaproteobacteria bacterium]MBT4640198.1 NADH-quinone oxidoreductase subunit N [Deltaproteobacteria bacterium]MBT6500847.1 NADH-quinone oxidoreductase subunit N [Deltaproteobacteria bacterium]